VERGRSTHSLIPPERELGYAGERQSIRARGLLVDVADGLSGECSIIPASGLKAYLAAH